mgnify:CR=1 FL=1
MSQNDIEQQQINEQIIGSLDQIHAQNIKIASKIDRLETHITKKATVAGAVSGAVAGGVTSGLVSLGIELIKAKFGG